mmetsp:Transcript_28494/g.92369  ORF Transcript_28494/g.92369 Transcript_28494/m.92369 type:complete len:94 (-) Transcript_28494:505-786(-)
MPRGGRRWGQLREPAVARQPQPLGLQRSTSGLRRSTLYRSLRLRPWMLLPLSARPAPEQVTLPLLPPLLHAPAPVFLQSWIGVACATPTCVAR